METIKQLKIAQLQKRLLKRKAEIAYYSGRLIRGSITYQQHFNYTREIEKEIQSTELEIAQLNDDTIFVSKLNS
jgi:hypothetical protein